MKVGLEAHGNQGRTQAARDVDNDDRQSRAQSRAHGLHTPERQGQTDTQWIHNPMLGTVWAQGI